MVEIAGQQLEQALHTMTLPGAVPISAESVPPTRRSIPHGEISYDKLIRAILGHDTLTHVSTHSNIDQDSEILHRSCTSRFACLHDRSSINIPHHSSLLCILILIPSKIKSHTVRRVDGRDWRFHHTVFIVVFAVEMAPMHTSMVCLFSIPGFEDIHFAVVGPGEWVLREQPKRRPNAWSHWSCNPSGQTTSASSKRLMRRQSRRSKLSVLLRMVVVDYCMNHQRAILGVETVCSVVDVVLGFVVAPTPVSLFVVEVRRDGDVW